MRASLGGLWLLILLIGNRACGAEALHDVVLHTPGGKFVSAGGGRGVLAADQPHFGPWETFTLCDKNGDEVEDGDVVWLRAWDDRYWSADPSSGEAIGAKSERVGRWESFVIERRDGPGIVKPEDAIGLRSSDGHYLITDDQDGARLKATGQSFDQRAVFYMTVGNACIPRDLLWPIDKRVVSGFGFGTDWTVTDVHGRPILGADGQVKLHNGYDIGATADRTEVDAADVGKVAWVGTDSGGWGPWIVIEHTDQQGSAYTTLYFHVNPEVRIGDPIRKKGQRIGTVYKLLKAGPHLHFSIRNAPFDSGWRNEGPDKKRYTGAASAANRGALTRTGSFAEKDKGWCPKWPEFFVDPGTYTPNGSGSQEHQAAGRTEGGGTTKKQPSSLGSCLIIDRSGSMQGEKIALVRQAIGSYAQVARDEDRIGLVAFDAAANVILPITPAGAARAGITSALQAIRAEGSTNIGAGLRAAIPLLQQCAQPHAILLSDGRNTAGEYQSAVAEYTRRGWPISTVAYGADADRPTLEAIARATRGTFYPADLTNLQHVYYRLQSESRQETTVMAVSDWLKSGKSLRYVVPVDTMATSLGVFVDGTAAAHVRLIAPDKQAVEGSGGGDGATYLTVPNPGPGNWLVEVSGISATPQQVNVAASVGGGDLAGSLAGFEPSYSAGQEVPLGVWVRGDNHPAKVEATILPPLPALQPGKLGEWLMKVLLRGKHRVTLYDDGRHNDGDAGDGYYGNTFSKTTEEGAYLVEVSLPETGRDGRLISRRLRQSLQIGQVSRNGTALGELLELLFRRP